MSNDHLHLVACCKKNRLFSLAMGQKMFFSNMTVASRESYSVEGNNSHHRVLQLKSSNSWSDVDWPLEGDLILPIIMNVFGVTEY